MTLTGEMRLSMWGSGSDGIELRLELSPDQEAGYWTVETSMRVEQESLLELAAELPRLFAQPPGIRQPPTLPAVGVHAVTAEEAAALAADAQRRDWPVFLVDGPRTEIQLGRKVVSTLPLDPPIVSRDHVNCDALSDSLFGGIDGLDTSNVLIRHAPT